MNIMNSKNGFLSIEILGKENKEFFWVRILTAEHIDYENIGRKVMKGWIPVPVDLANYYLMEDTCKSLQNNIDVTIKDNMFYGSNSMILFTRNTEIGNEERLVQLHLLE
jgi:hypothetical protein